MTSTRSELKDESELRAEMPTCPLSRMMKMTVSMEEKDPGSSREKTLRHSWNCKAMEKILPSAIEARKIARERQEKAVKDKITYRNKGLKKKIFRPGQIVIQRQLQLATGPGKAMQPKYQGPYVIIEIDKDESSALIEHMHSGQQVRAHFSNISLLNFLPQYHKAPARYEEQLLEFLPEKYSFKKYYPKSISKPIRPISSDGNVETY